MSPRRVARVLGLAVTATMLAGPAVAAHAVTTERVSVDTAGGDPNGVSATPSVSADGRFVAFASHATDIAAPAFGGVFLRDRRSGTSVRVDVDPRGGGQPSVSDDGRYVAYIAEVGPFPGSPTHVFVRDVLGGTTTPVDVALGGGLGAGGTPRISMSGDGRHVAFVSDAPDLVPGDRNDQPDVFVRDLDRGTTVRANVDAAGGDSGYGDFGSGLFGDATNVLSRDGRHVVFKSASSDLVAGDADDQDDIFVRDLVTGVTRLVSDAPQVAVVRNPAISPDGRRVAYTNAQFGRIYGGDVLVRDLATGGTVQANVATQTVGSFSFSAASFSADGRLVAFDSSSSNSDIGDNTPFASNVFVRDLAAGTTTRVSVDATGGAPDGSSFDPAMSADGRSVAFVSSAPDLVPGDANGLRDVFVADLSPRNARTRLVALGELIRSFALPRGVTLGLTATVRVALAALDRGHPKVSCVVLGAVAAQTRALRGRRLTPAQAARVLEEVAGIRTLLGCR